MDPTAAERARLNFAVSAWSERWALKDNLSQLKRMELAAARDALESLLDQLSAMLALHEEHARRPPLAAQQALAAKFFEHAAQVKQRLDEGLHARE
jgi:hypothetical protein